MLSIASTGHLSRPETSLSRVISSKVKLSYLSKTVKWLRGDNAHSNLSIIFRRASLALISSMLIVSLIGIPLLLSGVKEWKKQQHNKKLLHIEPIVLDTPISDQPITVKLTPAQILSQHKKELLRHAVDPLLRAEPPFFPTSSTNPPWKTMMGISLIADYLAKKNNLDSLFVCESLKAFKNKIDSIKELEGDARVALIVPSYQSDATCDRKKCDRKSHRTPDFHAQHKVAVLIEKTEGQLKIFVCDSSIGFDNPRAAQLDNRKRFNCSDLIHAYLRESKLKNAIYYYSTVSRHHSQRGGCETFALRDAVHFLKSPNFFSEVDKRGFEDDSKGNGSFEHPYFVTNLPPQMMKSAQSFRQLKAYQDNNRKSENGYDLDELLGTKQRTFADCLKKHTRVVDEHEQNGLIDSRIYKYHQIILDEMKKLNSKELASKVSRRLIR